MIGHQCTFISCSDKDMAQEALNVMRCRTAYIKPETVAFSFASDAVSDEDKTTMATVLLGKEASDDDDATLVIDSGTSLSDLIGGLRLALSLVGMDVSL